MNELTAKEQLILDLVQQGLTNYQITAQTGINPTNLTNRYLRSIKDKLGVTSKAELIALKKEVSHEG